MEMTPESPTVSLELASRAENLTLVRGMISGVGELLAIDPELLDDVKTAVSEACNNVVMHAYHGDTGPLAVSLYMQPDGLSVAVRDQGDGIAYVAPHDDDRLDGIGVPVIQALASETEFRPVVSGGTEVWMSFAGERDGRPLFASLGAAAPDDGWTKRVAGDAVVSLSPVSLLSAVLGRLARALAASARFSLDRFSDVYLVTDALSALAHRNAARERIGFCLVGQSRRLEIMIGPFRPGTSELLRSDDPVIGARSPLALLTDQIETEPDDGDNERLRVVMTDTR